MTHPAKPLWVDPAALKADGVDPAALTRWYAGFGIRLVTGEATETPDGRFVCPGCDEALERNHLTWRYSTLPGREWQPLCRKCEGTEFAESAKALRKARWRAQRRERLGARKKTGPKPKTFNPIVGREL